MPRKMTSLGLLFSKARRFVCPQMRKKGTKLEHKAECYSYQEGPQEASSVLILLSCCLWWVLFVVLFIMGTPQQLGGRT
jgi:hypothetical protein